jgi:hypothetical protein
MSTANLKSEFHKLIDEIKDETILESFFGAIKDLANRKQGIDIIDELSSKQQKRLMQSLAQKETDKTISNDQMKKEILQWLGK